jgi:ankyrin repeat protein
MMAAEKGHAEVVQLLVAAGADLHAEDKVSAFKPHLVSLLLRL